jgi:hypothetical protein
MNDKTWLWFDPSHPPPPLHRGEIRSRWYWGREFQGTSIYLNRCIDTKYTRRKQTLERLELNILDDPLAARHISRLIEDFAMRGIMPPVYWRLRPFDGGAVYTQTEPFCRLTHANKIWMKDYPDWDPIGIPL